MSAVARRPRSAVAAIGGFGIGVALLSVAATAAIVLIAPEPDGLRMSIRDAAIALRGGTTGFERSIGAEPAGRRALIFEAVLADQVQRPRGDVRIVMTDPSSDPARAMANGKQVGISSQPPVVIFRGTLSRSGDADATSRRERFVLRSDDLRVLDPMNNPPPAVRAGLAAVPINAFVASVRQPDGRWLTVRPYQPWLSGWRLRVLAAMLVSLLLIVPLAWLFARRLTRPFRALAQAVDTGDGAIPIDGPRELREAAAAIAAMRTRLAREAAERTRMLTAIAHDLRTPLTSLRLRIEATPEPQRARMVADIDRMQAMIAEVLDFARDAETNHHPLAVRPLLAEIVADMDAGRAIVTLGSGDDAWIDAAPLAFRCAIENLMRNAIAYAGGGWIETRLTDGAIIIAVCDRGPGIAAQDGARLLLPFERGEGSRNRDTGGAGLGLSIVQAFAVRQRGAFALLAGAAGGTRAELRLPVMDRQSTGSALIRSSRPHAAVEQNPA